MKVFDDTMSLKLNHVYPDEYIKWLGIKGFGKGGIRKKRQKCNSILLYALNYILNSIILYDKYYSAPYRGKSYFIMCMTAKGRKEVAYILKSKPLYKHIDLIQTKGIIYQIGMYFPMLPKGKRRVRVRVGKKHWYAIEAMANSGKRYSMVNHETTIMERVKHSELVDYVHQAFPEEDRRTIHRCIQFGMKRIGKFTAKGHGVNFVSSSHNFSFRSFYYQRITAAMAKKQFALKKDKANCNARGEKSKHQKLKEFLTWHRTKTSLKKGSNLASIRGSKSQIQQA